MTPPHTVVVVEDEGDLRDAVAEYLADRGLHVLTAADGRELRALAERESFDVAVLDITMPGEDGLSLARWLRGRPNRPGVLFATASGATVDRVVGLEIGADDYVVKPYHMRELLARIRAVLRRLPEPGTARASPAAQGSSARTVRIGPHALDLGSHRLTGPGGQAIDLTPGEYEVLARLVAQPNRVLSRGQLLGEDREGERSIDICITRLRRKIEADPGAPTLIQTVRGEGYVFVPGQA